MAADHVAGHPIAIRVGGRRMSQSNPIRSPTKSQQTPSSSLESNGSEGGGVNAIEVPDYPRPRSPNSAAKVNSKNDAGVTEREPAPTVEEEAAKTNQQTSNGNNSGGGGNRQERRRQERRREKSHRDGEDTNNNNSILSSHNDAMFNHLNKRFNDRNTRNDSMAGSKGVRITQPAGKFMT